MSDTIGAPVAQGEPFHGAAPLATSAIKHRPAGVLAAGRHPFPAARYPATLRETGLSTKKTLGERIQRLAEAPSFVFGRGRCQYLQRRRPCEPRIAAPTEECAARRSPVAARPPRIQAARNISGSATVLAGFVRIRSSGRRLRKTNQQTEARLRVPAHDPARTNAPRAPAGSSLRAETRSRCKGDEQLAGFLQMQGGARTV